MHNQNRYKTPEIEVTRFETELELMAHDNEGDGESVTYTIETRPDVTEIESLPLDW